MNQNTESCPDCWGRGILDGDPNKRCPFCDGTGRRVVQHDGNFLDSLQDAAIDGLKKDIDKIKRFFTG